MGLETALLGLTLVSGVTQAVGAYSSGKAAKKAADYNAAISRQEAEIAQQQAKIEIARTDKEKQRYLARQSSMYAKAGVELSGSPLLVMLDTAAEFEYEKELIDYNASIGASRAYSRAAQETYAGKVAYDEGLMKAGQTLLGTTLSMGQQYLYGRRVKTTTTAEEEK